MTIQTSLSEFGTIIIGFALGLVISGILQKLNIDFSIPIIVLSALLIGGLCIYAESIYKLFKRKKVQKP